MDKFIKIRYYLPVISAVLLIYRSQIASLVWPAIILLFFSYLTYFFDFRNTYKIVKDSFKKNFLLLIIAGIYLFVLLISNVNDKFIYKELFRTIIVLLIFFSLYIDSYSHGREKLLELFTKVFLSTNLVLLFYFYIKLIFWGQYSYEAILPNTDYNFFALQQIIAIIFLLDKIYRIKPKLSIVFGVNIYLFLLSTSIIISTSRRGLVALILLHLFVILFSLFKSKFKQMSKRLILYFSFLLIVFISGFILLVNINLTNYIGKTILSDESAKSVQAMLYRYRTVIGIRDEQNTIFLSESVLNRLIVRKILPECRANYELNKFDDFYNNLEELSHFYPSKNDFIDEFNILKEISDTFFTSANSIGRIPFCYNVEYNFDHSFIPQSFSNVYFSKYDPYNKDNMFQFEKQDIHKLANVMSLLPVSDSSLFILKYSVPINEKLPTVRFLDASKKEFLAFELDTNIRNDYIDVTCKLEIFNIQPTTIQLLFSLNDSITDISAVTWFRQPLFYRLGLVQSDEVRSYNFKESVYITKKAFEQNKRKIPNQEIDIDFLRSNQNKILENTQFKNYKNSSINILSNDSLYVNPVHNGVFLIGKIIPALYGNSYVISFKTNIKQNNLIIKKLRSPEVSPNFLFINNLGTQFNIINDSIIEIIDSFDIKESSSLQMKYVIGSKAGTRMSVSDFNIKLFCTDKKDSLSIRQQVFAFKLINQIKKIEHDYSGRRDSVLNKYGLLNYSDKNRLLNSRIDRWHFAFNYFKKRSLAEKLFGDKLNYISVFGVAFWKKDEIRVDYPHNPIISSFLYSGILGGLLYIYFLFIVFWRYWKLRKELGLFAILYILTFTFTFFSGNSHFSVPAFTILSLIPFAFEIGIQNKS